MREYRVVGDTTRVDKATKRTVREQYDLEDEIKLLRRAIVALSKGEPLPQEFVHYNDFVERVVEHRRRLKRSTETD